MKRKYLIISTVCLLLSGGISAQVTIGSGTPPNKGALLDLKEKADGSSTKGLALPRVKLTSNSDITNGHIEGVNTGNKSAHIGLMVYNTGKVETSAAARLCPGLHVWDGNKWQPLSPYPVWDNERTLVSDKIIGFTHLDHSQPGTWSTGKTPASYPLGYIGTFPDNRVAAAPINYHHTRYYVGVANRQKTYDVKESFSCDPNTPNWITGTETDPAYDIFEDGVWMNENLRAEIMDPTRDKTGETVAMLTGPDYNTGNPYNTTVWGYPNKQSANKATHGLLYTWAAATNAKGGATGQENTQDEGGLSEGLPVQGVCPTGWHLPSDREFTDLENGIILHTALFSSTPNINTTLDYTSSGRRGGHGIAIRPTSTGGTSKVPTGGGFDFLLAGQVYNGSAFFFGTGGYLWSASSGDGSGAWYRDVHSSNAGVARGNYDRAALFSVRCKKN